jgi:DNA-binding NarL/FixJ family response regulator
LLAVISCAGQPIEDLTFVDGGLICQKFFKPAGQSQRLSAAGKKARQSEPERVIMAKAKKNKSSGLQHQIFLVEDHPVFREGLAKLLNAEADLAVCGEAGDAKTGLKDIRRLKPDLALVDLGLPGKSGLELIKEIRALKLPVKLLVVSMFDEALYAERVLRAGGDGYIMKQEDPHEIILAIRDVLGGHIYVSEDVFARTTLKQSSEEKGAGALDQLTDSELEVLELLGQGRSAVEISSQLELPAVGVKGQIASIRRKLKLKSDNALVRYAVCWVEDSAGGLRGV